MYREIVRKKRGVRIEPSGWPPMGTWVCPNIRYAGIPNQNPSQQIWKEKPRDYLKLLKHL
jgi:hypothetical protein